MAELSELDRRILVLLGSYGGPGGIYPSSRTLAARLGVSRRHVRRRLAALEAAGQVERMAVYERPSDADWTARGRRVEHLGRQTSNTYRLVPCPPPLGHAPEQTIESSPSVTPRTSDDSQARDVLPVKPLSIHTPEVGDGVGSGEVAQADVLGVELAAAPAIEPRKVVLDPAQCDTWDHKPTGEELRGVIAQAFGDGAEVEVIPHPTYTTARGRVIDLETCSVDDVHQALDQLARHTCSNGDRCVPCAHHRGPAGADARCPRCRTCKRHSPRRRAR